MCACVCVCVCVFVRVCVYVYLYVFVWVQHAAYVHVFLNKYVRVCVMMVGGLYKRMGYVCVIHAQIVLLLCYS